MTDVLFMDDFDDPRLDLSRWIPEYLPQWSSRAAARPRYRIHDGCLVLEIGADQAPWCPEFNGDVRVSALQTGVFSGPLGSHVGQHRFAPECRVREEQVARRTFTSQYGRFEVRARCLLQPSNVAAVWLIGYEDRPERSAEICLVEVKGGAVEKSSAVIGYGIHPFGDPALVDEFFEEPFDVDVSDFHVYAAEWGPGGVTFSIDGRPVRSSTQSPDYPMQIMVTLYDLAPAPASAGPASTTEFWIDYVRVEEIPG